MQFTCFKCVLLFHMGAQLQHFMRGAVGMQLSTETAEVWVQSGLTLSDGNNWWYLKAV